MVAWCTPKFRRNPRTVAMMANAATGFCFKRNGGMLYTVPRNKPKQYSLEMSGPKLVSTMAAPSAANVAHAAQASGTVSSPAATGRNGLFTLSMSTS